MREITTHHDGSGLNERIAVRAGDPGPGGAPGLYTMKCYEVAIDDLISLAELHFNTLPPADGPNGVTHETLLAVLIDRLEWFQAGPFACAEDGVALRLLRDALDCLKARTRNRPNPFALATGKESP